MTQRTTVIYTDGSHRSDEGRNLGVWGYMIQGDTDCLVGIVPVETCTSIQAEMHAILEAVRNTPTDQPLRIHSDCLDLVRVIARYRKRGTRPRLSSTKAFIREFTELTSDREVELLWVRGHSGNKFNRHVDHAVRDRLRAAWDTGLTLDVLLAA